MTELTNPGSQPKKLFLAKIIGLLFVFFVSHADAATPSPADHQKKPKNLFFCPPISAIIKDPEKLTWSAPGGWQSYEISFVNKIVKFYGAQWNGENVGQMTCLYKGEEAASFLILLVYETLTYQPSGGAWSKNLGGYLNCKSRKRLDCPFKIRLKPKQENIYEEAEKLKSNSDY